MSKQSFTDNTYSLARALHNIKIGKEYFDFLKMENEGELKNLFHHCSLKSQWIIDNIYDRLNDESRAVLKEELSDSLCIDSINDNLVHLTNEQRLTIEKITEAMKKGEDVYVGQ